MRRIPLVLPAWYLATITYLFVPIAVSLLYAFNEGSLGKQTSTFTGWTSRWFAEAWGNPSLRRAMETSLTASLWTALAAVVLGTCLGLALTRHPSSLVRRGLALVCIALLVVPETVIGVSLLLFFAETEIPLGMLTLVCGISPLAMAVTALIIRSGLLTLDHSLEEAAIDLGASPYQVIRDIIFPQLLPALLVSALISYVFAFDNLVISNFLSTPVVNTLPAYLFGSLQYGPSPATYAAAASVFGLTLLLVGVAGLIYVSTFGRKMMRNA